MRAVKLLIQSDLKRSSCNNINWVLAFHIIMTDKKDYKVLARKYRPTLFKELVGQDLLVEILSNSILHSRIPHAYVLTGVRGVGKTTTARLIAKSLNCLNRENKNFEPCNICETCNAFQFEKNMDIIEMDAASNTGVDDIREILDSIKYKPLLGKFKIFIIDEVHMLSKSAFNALLKTLEEPPEHIKFIFATTEVKKIPLTVLSRCQRFDLRRVSQTVLIDHMNKISNMENIKIDQDALALIVRASDGSVRDALSLLDQAISKTNEIDTNNIVEMLGLADRGKIFDLLEDILEGNTENALKKYQELYTLGADVIMIFDEILNIIHYLTQLKVSPNLEKDIYVPEFERSKGSLIASKLTLNDLGILWQVTFKGFEELQKGFHLYQHGEMLILRLLFFDNNFSPDSEKKNKIPNRNNENITEIAQKKNEDELNNTENQVSYRSDSKSSRITVKDFRQFVELFYVNREGIIHSKLYNNVGLVSFKEGEVIINVDKVSEKDFIRTISKLISKWTGRIWKINSSSSNICKTLNEEDIINQQKEIEIMKNNIMIKKILLEIPGSKIHSISELSESNDLAIESKDNIRKEK